MKKKPDRGRGERKKRGEEKWGAGELLLLLLSPYLLSLSRSFFSFCLSKGKLDGQSFATSSLQPVHLAAAFSALGEASEDRRRRSSVQPGFASTLSERTSGDESRLTSQEGDKTNIRQEDEASLKTARCIEEKGDCRVAGITSARRNFFPFGMCQEDERLRIPVFLWEVLDLV